MYRAAYSGPYTVHLVSLSKGAATTLSITTVRGGKKQRDQKGDEEERHDHTDTDVKWDDSHYTTFRRVCNEKSGLTRLSDTCFRIMYNQAHKSSTKFSSDTPATGANWLTMCAESNAMHHDWMNGRLKFIEGGK